MKKAVPEWSETAYFYSQGKDIFLFLLRNPMGQIS